MYMRGRYFRRGAYVACGAACIGVVLLVVIGLAYDGKCGGFFPGLSAPRSCTFVEYLSGDVLVFALILGVTYWPLVLAVLFLPPLVGYVLDRRSLGPPPTSRSPGT
jgi:hypothetical protein